MKEPKRKAKTCIRLLDSDLQLPSVIVTQREVKPTRSVYHYRFTENKVKIVKWNDNYIVNVATNILGIQPHGPESDEEIEDNHSATSQHSDVPCIHGRREN
ncbi:hypothetical protein QE152_g30895 [Popillia japonica]|uniref:PiggyBac transposable element-derived protein domain-containing protein n=1 Tax=Popillia japonica TaxID=7064 RepID=A0AAW1JDM3_POPJA